MRRLDNWLDSYLLYTDNTEPSTLFKTWCGISIITACMQRKCWVKWGRDTIYPNFYIVLIGPSGARKSYAVGQALRFLVEPGLNLRMATDSTSRANLIRDFSESTQIFMQPNGAAMPHSSITVIAPEFTVFLGYNNIQLMTDLVDWYDSIKNPWIHKTVASGGIEIVGPLMNILGATTPDALQKAMGSTEIGIGFIARLIMLYAPRKEKTVIDDTETLEESALRQTLLDDLGQISLMGGQWRISERCLDFYYDWYAHFNEEEECKDPKFSGYFNRKPTTLKKLSFVLSASRGEDRVISLRDMQRAMFLLDCVEEKMYHCLQGIGRNQYAAVTNKIMSELARRKSMSQGDLLYQFRDEVTKFELLKILETIEAFGFCSVYSNTGQIVYNEGFGNGRK